jgi:hypothetical protein
MRIFTDGVPSVIGSVNDKVSLLYKHMNNLGLYSELILYDCVNKI